MQLNLSIRRTINKSMDFQYQDSDLLAFVDETGHPSLSDPAHRVFGVGGCAVPFTQYSDLVENPWRALRSRHFASSQGPLHAAELNPSGAAIADIASLFRETPFYRIAVLVDHRWTAGNPYDPCGTMLIAFLHQIAVKSGCRRIVLTFESLGALDHIPSHYFDLQARFTDSQADCIPIQVFRARKQDALPGLEIADFIMHAAGAQVRKGLTVPTQRKDFRAVFSDVPDSWVHFGLLDDRNEGTAPPLPVV